VHDEFSGALTVAELRRYGRHLVLPEVGPEGQERLRGARVLIVGMGGLGSPVALYLAAAGVGTLGLVDFDRVEESNLQRQILYGQSDLGALKVEAAARRLAETNPWVRCEPHAVRFSAANALPLLASYDLVVDGTDNFPTRYLLNDACVLGRRPFVYGSIYRFEGQVSVFGAPGGPCYRCLFPDPPPPGLVPSCEEGGVLGVLPGTVGTAQATEVLKMVLGIGRPLAGRLLVYDALASRWREVRVARNPECPVCGDRPSIRELVEIADSCVAAEATTPAGDGELEVEGLAAFRAANPETVILDVRTPMENRLARLADSVLIPLPELAKRWGELAADRPTVVYCHHGNRSAHAVAFLRERGFAKVFNLRGGIAAFSERVDPSLPRY
jgi:sulfur-carrier protein adenylyltransferase/sulfurtransferase